MFKSYYSSVAKINALKTKVLRNCGNKAQVNKLQNDF